MQEKKEYILCAAIHYVQKYTNVSPRQNCYTVAGSPINIETGYVLCGFRHDNIIKLNYSLGGETTTSKNSVQGFLTSKNRFVDRKEALKIALAANQVLDISNLRGEILFSEDLY